MPAKLNWLLSASLAFGGLAFIVPATVQAADEANPAAPTAGQTQNVGDQKAGTISERTTGGAPLALPAGAKQSDKPANAAKLSKPIAGVANQALDKNGLSDVVGYFVDQDRDRIRDEIKKLDATQLNGRIDQINKAWQDKYGKKFDADAKDFTANQAVEGEIEDANTFVQNWPVPVVSGLSDTSAAANAAGSNAQQASNKTVDEDTRKNGNIEKGRNVAIVRLPAENGIPAMDVSEISELLGWKIDVPNNRTAQQIHDDMLKHLTMFGDDTSKWPADELQAKRIFARHVLEAIYGIDTSQTSSQSPAK